MTRPHVEGSRHCWCGPSWFKRCRDCGDVPELKPECERCRGLGVELTTSLADDVVLVVHQVEAKP